MAQRFRWGIWGTVAAIIVVGAGITFAATRGPKVTYDNVNSPRPVDGNASSKVVLQEFSDFQCPACGSAFPFVKQLMTTYKDKLRFEYKHFPLTKIHAHAYNAALASECANDQGKFWEMHDKLFSNQTALSSGNLKQYAQDLGLDTTKFNACYDTRAEKSVVDADVKEGTSKNVQGTPTFFLNGTQVQFSSYAELESAVRAATGGTKQGPVQ
ncbi:MAG: DsbA family protein [Patescibacteria group bacterium]